MIKLGFDLQLQDGISRFHVFHIIIGASLILTQISFKLINRYNNNDDDITTITITTTTSYYYQGLKLQRLHHQMLGMDK